MSKNRQVQKNPGQMQRGAKPSGFSSKDIRAVMFEDMSRGIRLEEQGHRWSQQMPSLDMIERKKSY